MKKLEGKVSIVTGAARNLGKGIAERFAMEESEVVVVDIDAEEAEKSFNDIKSRYENNGFWMQVDVTKSDQVEKMVNEVIERLGTIDILVNNAGVITTNPVVDLSEEDFDYVMGVNIKGVFLCTRAVLKEMIKKRSGKIISISSKAGRTGINYLAHYCASKFAVIGFTQALAQELIQYNINVNAICPGSLNLPQHFGPTKKIMEIQGVNRPLEEVLAEQRKGRILGRLGEPEDIAKLAVFLASEDAEYITGEAINVAGGEEVH